jgi:PHD/YefM family antitoxin component YafN of YafNO toxin-antitoxin module
MPGGPVVITKNGQMKAFLVPYDEDEFPALMAAVFSFFPKMMEKAAASKVRVRLNEVKKRLGKKRG